MTEIFMNLSTIIRKLESVDVLGSIIIERDTSKNSITICVSYEMTPIVFIENNKITHIDLFVSTCPILYQWAGLEVTILDDMDGDSNYS